MDMPVSQEILSDKLFARTVNAPIHQHFTSTVDTSDMMSLAFVEDLNIQDVYCSFHHFDTHQTIFELFTHLKKIVGQEFVRSLPTPDGHYLMIFESAVVEITQGSSQPVSEFGNEDDHKVSQSFGVWITASIENACRIQEQLKKDYPLQIKEKKGEIEWWYSGSMGIQRQKMPLVTRYEIHDSFYPWIPQGIAAFQKEYLESTANVLLLTGNPGTGKTSLLRDMIKRNNLSAMITFDQKIMTEDSFFINFLQSKYDVAIIEDAEVLLRDRKDGNMVMNKILNTTDGLIQTDKKLIFTANITHLDEIDEALLRPGRCFAALTFRELWAIEATKAARDAGVSDPQASVTLSELFTKTMGEKEKRVGFNI